MKLGDTGPNESQALDIPIIPNVSIVKPAIKGLLGGGFKHVLFSSLFGEDSHFD